MKSGLIIDANGDKFWYLDDQLHRIGAPAIERADGDKSWWINDELHREDGPAMIWDGVPAWFLNGVEMSEAQHAQAVKEM